MWFAPRQVREKIGESTILFTTAVFLDVPLVGACQAAETVK